MDEDKKAGHPPAAKMAGGVRVKGHAHKYPAEEKNTTEQAEDNNQENPADVEPPTKNESSVTISGYASKGNKDFTAEAISSYHEKPRPTVDKRIADKKGPTSKQNFTIQQPRK
ncbi:Death-associated protein-like 1-A [Trichoplax sp. H2]|nr:Death-associated protein-like 1-A [Trichoplax sp. H2]|eukprot:RDD46329.1 Death-associated protein-like 1-A [Trichoplax sp. H2]